MGKIKEIKDKLANENTKKGMETILDQLFNNDSASDDEIIDILADETSYDKKQMKKVVKGVRDKILKSPAMKERDAEKLVKKLL